MSRALTNLRVNNANEAVADLTRVLELNPKYTSAYFNRAVGYFQLKQYDKAWADVPQGPKLRTQAINPDFIEALKKAK